MTFITLLLLTLSQPVRPQDEIENSEFKAWVTFKVGSWVKIHEKGRRVSLQDGTVTLRSGELSPYDEAEMMWKLVESSAERVVLEGEGWTVSGGEKTKVSARRREILAKAPGKPGKGLPPPVGKDELKIAGKTLSCRWEESVIGSYAAPVNGKKRWEGKAVRRTWFCDQVPGGLAKQETELRGPRSVGDETRKVVVLDWSGDPRTPTESPKPPR